jgi:hypothetical protein
MKTLTAKKPYKHYTGGHCESGSVSSIVKNYGFELSEPMALGISSNIAYAFFPFIKVWGRPLIAYRMMPQNIVKGVQKRLGIKFWMKTYKYKDQQEAMDNLDRLLSEGKPVGLQMNVSFLEYFCGEFRIPINGHMATIHSREGEDYIVSDPLFDSPKRVKRDDLRKARFAKGPNAPRGFIFYPLEVPETIDYKKAIEKSVKHVIFMMLQPMFPYYGILGIKTFSRYVRKLQNHPDKKFIRAFIGHVVIFQEDQGTGGGGFRYIYGAFLKEAYELLKYPELIDASKKMIAIGDKWRLAAASCGKFLQGKTDTVDLNKAADMYLEIAQAEKDVYLLLKKIKWN